jgi:hypothetical protein
LFLEFGILDCIVVMEDGYLIIHSKMFLFSMPIVDIIEVFFMVHEFPNLKCDLLLVINEESQHVKVIVLSGRH